MPWCRTSRPSFPSEVFFNWTRLGAYARRCSRYPLASRWVSSSMHTKEGILKAFELFFAGTGGLDSWLRPDTPEEVFERLGTIDEKPLSRVESVETDDQLEQTYSRVSNAFFAAREA